MSREYRYQSPLELCPLDHSQLLANLGNGVYLEPPGLPRTYQRPTPMFLDDPDGAKIFSSAAMKSRPVVCPPAFVLSLREVTLAGYRTFLTSDGRFMNDQAYVNDARLTRYLNRFTRAEDFRIERSGLRRVAEEKFEFDEGDRRHINLKGTVVVLSSREPDNYGSFLFRVLPKLTLVAPDGAFRFLVGLRHSTMRELLTLSGVSEEKIIAQDFKAIYHIEHAVVPSLRNPDAFLDDATLDFYAAMRRRFGSTLQDRKLYISRLEWRESVAGRKRIMLNEAELIERLRTLNFQIVEPQSLSAAEQIRLFSSAEILLGAQGSGMFNVVFCQPGTYVVDIESAPNWVHAHMCLFGSCKTRFGIFEGSRVTRSGTPGAHQPFTCNIDALVHRVSLLS